MHFVLDMCFLTQVQFVKFKISTRIRLDIMFGNSFRLPNILARTNKPGLLSAFQNSMNMLSFDGVFCYDKHNIFLMKIYNIVEYNLTILNI